MERENPKHWDGERAIKLNVAAALGSAFFGFFFQISLVKILVPGEFATYAVAFAALTVFTELLSFGVGAALIRFVPWCMVSGDLRGLRGLARRMIGLRAISLLVVAMLLVFGERFSVLLPITFGPQTVKIFLVWMTISILYQDVFFLAQSLRAQRETAIVTVSETAARLAALYSIYLLNYSLDARSVILISASTSALSLIWLSYRVWRRFELPSDLTQENSTGGSLSFALGRYASAIAWLISSPSAVRLVAARGLGVLPLAAFSFVQGLYVSLQRAFPGRLLINSIEPILLTKLAQGVKYEKALSSVSVIFKLELFFALSVFIASVIGGPAIITLLARPEYAPYWYILMFMGFTQAINVVYRVLEFISSAVAKQTIFFWIWPLGIVSNLCIYLTVQPLGIWAPLVFTFLEAVLRGALVMYFFRRDGIGIAFDLPRSLIMILSAVTIAIPIYLVQPSQAAVISTLLITIIGLATFVLMTCISRPLRPVELELILRMIPADWRRVRVFASGLTRPHVCPSSS
jgi:O-antigen/teichoic acid export membrane protein